MGRRPNLQLIQLISREVYTDPFVLCMTQNKMLIYVADRTHAYQKKILDEHEKKLGMARDEYHRKLWKERDRERLKFNPSPDSRYKGQPLPGNPIPASWFIKTALHASTKLRTANGRRRLICDVRRI